MMTPKEIQIFIREVLDEQFSDVGFADSVVTMIASRWVQDSKDTWHEAVANLPAFLEWIEKNWSYD